MYSVLYVHYLSIKLLKEIKLNFRKVQFKTIAGNGAAASLHIATMYAFSKDLSLLQKLQYPKLPLE